MDTSSVCMFDSPSTLLFPRKLPINLRRRTAERKILHSRVSDFDSRAVKENTGATREVYLTINLPTLSLYLHGIFFLHVDVSTISSLHFLQHASCVLGCVKGHGPPQADTATYSQTYTLLITMVTRLTGYRDLLLCAFGLLNNSVHKKSSFKLMKDRPQCS